MPTLYVYNRFELVAQTFVGLYPCIKKIFQTLETLVSVPVVNEANYYCITIGTL